MKSTLLFLMIFIGAVDKASGQILAERIDNNSEVSTSWDGTTLFISGVTDPICFGTTTWNFLVLQPQIVEFELGWLGCPIAGCDGKNWPGVGGPQDFYFDAIEMAWHDQGGGCGWGGTFILPAGVYEEISFWDIFGSITFSNCESGLDTDGDGIGDCIDQCPLSPDNSDTDGDGYADCIDLCPNNPTKIEPLYCGCDVDDSDMDGADDCIDGCPLDPNKVFPGDCGCGVNESDDSDGDGTADCVDNCPDDPDKTEPGFCGCGTVDTNVNGDVDCDGDYDIDDIRLGMTNFGIEEAEEDTCPADVDGDGSVGFSDVLNILNDWGACP